MKFRKHALDMIQIAVTNHFEYMQEMLTEEIQERLGSGSTDVDSGVTEAIAFLEQYRTTYRLMLELQVGRESMEIHDHEMSIVREAFETFDDEDRDVVANEIVELMNPDDSSTAERETWLNAVLQKDRDRMRLYSRINHEQ